MKLKQLKLANSVRISGSVEEMYLTSDKYELTLDNNLIYIKDIATGNVVVTSLYNTIWMTFIDEQSNPTGTSKKKSK